MQPGLYLSVLQFPGGRTASCPDTYLGHRKRGYRHSLRSCLRDDRAHRHRVFAYFRDAAIQRTAYSPRFVLWMARNPGMSHSMGVFTATFLYAIAALAWVDRGGSGKVTLAGTLVVTVLLIVSVITFIILIQRVGMLQINRMLTFTADQGRRIIESLYPPLETTFCRGAAETPSSHCLQLLLYRGRPTFYPRGRTLTLYQKSRVEMPA